MNRNILGLCFAALLSGLTTAQAAPPTAADISSPEFSIGNYKLAESDKIRVTVFNEPTLSGDFGIGLGGTISLPLLGEVAVKGMTSIQAAQAIQVQLAGGYLKDPKVSVEVLAFRPYYVLGEVNHAAEIPYTGEVTVAQAIAAAQGFTYRAKKDYVFLKRAGSDHEVKATLTTKVLPGDTIRAAERYF